MQLDLYLHHPLQFEDRMSITRLNQQSFSNQSNASQPYILESTAQPGLDRNSCFISFASSQIQCSLRELRLNAKLFVKLLRELVDLLLKAQIKYLQRIKEVKGQNPDIVSIFLRHLDLEHYQFPGASGERLHQG